jgi:fatty acid amide hydrolase
MTAILLLPYPYTANSAMDAMKMRILTDSSAPYGYVITTLAVAMVTASWWTNRQKIQTRRRLYQQWIRRARDERDGKEHKVLDHKNDDDDNDVMEEAAANRTAFETWNLVSRARLDPGTNVAVLASRCRKYARGDGEENADNKAAGTKVNAITEEFYDEAFQGAEALKKAGKPKGEIPPLYGVPISVKECFAVKGSYSTGGMACRLESRDEQDSLIVQVLRSAGALPLCSGNVTQLMFLPESVNNIWGRSRNPWDLERTPGGSSGGDAALVAMGCVPMAVCSDVAGSIRIPASFCGIVGFKPTSSRVSSKGNMMPRKNNKGGTDMLIPCVIGPIARAVEDCALFMKATQVPQLWDGDLNLPRIPFHDEVYQRPGGEKVLTIGYFITDGWFEPCATSKRAVQETVDALTKAGHTCVPFQLPTDGWLNFGLLSAINGADGYQSFIEALEGEPSIAEYGPLILATWLPNWLRWLLMKLIDKRSAYVLGQGSAGGITVWELWQRTAELTAMKSKWSEAMSDQGVDVIVYPAMPLPAFKHGLSVFLSAACSYMFISNLLDWPSGVVPVTTVRPDEAHYRKEDLPENQRDLTANHAAKIMQGSQGMPIGVSIMAPAFQDEKCLGVMKQVERLVNFQGKPVAYKHGR